MKTPSRLWLYAALIIGAAIAGREIASAAGGAGNIVTSVSSTDLIPLDSGTLASDVQLSTLATFFNSGGGGNATFGSGVNQITLTGAATGSPPIVGSGGASSDTNAPLSIDPKGTGTLFLSGTTTTNAADAMVVTDATVISSSNIVMCAVQGYAGTGVPIPVIVTPGTGSVSLKIQNVSTGAALNATVAVACNVVG